MEFKIDIKQQHISRGDIVIYDGKKCLVCEELYSPEILLVDLDTGLELRRYGTIEVLINSGEILLIAKNDDVLLCLNSQEVPF